MVNQVQVPLLHHDDPIVVQLQQNTNKVFKNFSNQTTSIQDAIEAMIIIGEVKQAVLTMEQFERVAGPGWLICDGQSCVDTEYARLTGNNVVPTIPPFDGVNSFILVN